MEALLPPKVVEQILSSIVDLYDDDPTYQWTQCRRLSASQKRRVERRFRDHWLRHMSLTLYCGREEAVDYTFSSVEPVPSPSHDTNEEAGSAAGPDADDAVAKFTPAEVSGGRVPGRVRRTGTPKPPLEPRAVKAHLDRHCFANRNVFVRLGERVLNAGLRGCYIVNDTDLPGLRVADDASAVWFRWRGAVDELLREDMFMRKITPGLMAEALSDPAAEKLLLTVPAQERDRSRRARALRAAQIPRRVAVLKHRVARHDPEGRLGFRFRRRTAWLHLQEPSPDPAGSHPDDEDEEEQQLGPDIFSVVRKEESLAHFLEDEFRAWREGEAAMDPWAHRDMLFVLCEELAWRYLSTENRDNVEVQRLFRDMRVSKALHAGGQEWEADPVDVVLEAGLRWKFVG